MRIFLSSALHPGSVGSIKVAEGKHKEKPHRDWFQLAKEKKRTGTVRIPSFTARVRLYLRRFQFFPVVCYNTPDILPYIQHDKYISSNQIKMKAMYIRFKHGGKKRRNYGIFTTERVQKHWNVRVDSHDRNGTRSNPKLRSTFMLHLDRITNNRGLFSSAPCINQFHKTIKPVA